MFQVIFDRVKTGCLLFERLDFLSAVKQWRIAVDQIPLAEKTARSAIMRNIGIAFVHLERYQVGYLSCRARTRERRRMAAKAWKSFSFNYAHKA